MGLLLTYVEAQNGRVKRSSLEVLSRCREIAAARGDAVGAAVAAANVGDLVDELGTYGAAQVWAVEDDLFADSPSVPLRVPFLSALTRIAEEAKPSLMAFSSSERVKELLGGLSVRLDAPALPDVSAFEVHEDAVEAQRPVLASKFLANVRAEGSPVLVTVRSGSYPATKASVQPEVKIIPFSFERSSLRESLREVSAASEGTADLSEARVVVAAGRGVRDDAGKRLIQQLADVTGAAIGSSRAVVEAGLFPASSQVGQTGKVVSPDLYFAVGISGAIQHVAGMTNSRVIVAVNKDPDAPIFKYATYGIVGDLYDVLPKLIQVLQKS